MFKGQLGGLPFCSRHKKLKTLKIRKVSKLCPNKYYFLQHSMKRQEIKISQMTQNVEKISDVWLHKCTKIMDKT